MPQTSSPGASPQPAEPPDSKKVILVVDDEPLIVEVLGLVLEAEGYAVHSTTTGLAALDWLDEHHADLVVLDFMMPGMDGGAVGQVLRERRGGAGLAIVISSALPERMIRERFSNYDAFLQKPYEMERFLGAVGRLLGVQPPRR